MTNLIALAEEEGLARPSDQALVPSAPEPVPVSAHSGNGPSRVPYAPLSARKLDEAAHLIVKASRLLDDHAPSIIALIEAIPGTEHINKGTADALQALASQLEQGDWEEKA